MSARTHCRRRYHDQGYPSPTPTPAPNQAALAVLEERRVALPPPPPLERNFHVFYMLATREAGSLLTAGRGVQRFRCALLVLTSPAPAPPPVCVCVCVCVPCSLILVKRRRTLHFWWKCHPRLAAYA